MSATGAAIQVRVIRPPWTVIAAIVLSIGFVGFVTGRVTERTTQPAPAAVAEQALPISGLATNTHAREIHQAIGELPSLRVDSPFKSENALKKAKVYEALGRLTGSNAGGLTPDIRRGSGATKSG
jgi:hypothetical protein